MAKRYNQKIREILYKKIDDLLLEGNSIDEVTSEFTDSLYDEYIMYSNEEYYNSNEERDLDKVEFEVRLYYISAIIYIDAYKYYNYKFNNLSLEEFEIDTFNELKEIESLDDVVVMISSEPVSYANMLRCAYDYENASGLTKLLMVRNLTDEDNDRLLNITEIHREDLEYYGETNPLNVARFIQSYNSYVNYYNRYYTEDPEDDIVKTFNNFLKQLYLVDKDNCIELIIDLAKNDYIMTKYLNSKINDDELKDYLKLYCSLSQSQIIDKLLHDRKLFRKVLFMNVDLYNNNIFENLNINPKNEDEITRKLTINK